MAVIVPLVSMYAAATAGAAIVTGAAAVTVGSFLAIAGGMMSGLGMLTKDKDFARIGGMLSLAGGLATGVQGAMAAEGAGEASAAFDVPDGSMDAAETAKFKGQGTPPPQAAAPADPAAAASAEAGESVLRMPGDAADLGYADAPPPTNPNAAQPNQLGRAASTQTTADHAATAAKAQTEAAVQSAQSGAAPQATTPSGGPSLFESAQGALKGVGGFIKANPQASQMMFQTMAGYAQDRNQQDEFAYRRSLMERAQRNANSPVKMGYYPATPVRG